MDARHTRNDSNKTPIPASASLARWLTLNRRAFMLIAGRIPPCRRVPGLAEIQTQVSTLCAMPMVSANHARSKARLRQNAGASRTSTSSQEHHGTHRVMGHMMQDSSSRLHSDRSWRHSQVFGHLHLHLHEGLRMQEEVDLQDRRRLLDRLDRQDRARFQERGRAMTWRSQHSNVDEPTTYLCTADSKESTIDQRRNNLIQRYLGLT